MKNREKAEILFRGLSDIDDGFLAEAEAYSAPRRRRFLLPAGIAAALLLCFSAALMLRFLSPLLLPKKENTEPQGLEQTLLSHREQTASLYTEQVEFGGDMLVWQFGDEEGYYVLPLDDPEPFLRLTGGGSPVSPEQSLSSELKIWLCTREGLVVSPQLLPSAGNTACRTLFDYRSELEPSPDFVNRLLHRLSRL